MASMIQQLNNTRENKQLTSKKIALTAYASCLNLFHNNSAFTWSFGIVVAVDYWWVKRISSDKYQYQVGWAITSNANPTEMGQSCWDIWTASASLIQHLHPDLVCHKDGEERLLILYAYRKLANFDKSKLGLLILEPNFVETDEYNNLNEGNKAIFYSIIVITPKPGLFPIKNDP